MPASAHKTPARRDVTITREFAAPRSRVFQMWTEAERMAQWWGPHGFTNPVCEVDARPGGAIRIHMRAPDGMVYPMRGTFEAVAPERLVFTAVAEDREGNALLEAHTTVTLAEQGDKTKLTVQASAVGLAPVASDMIAGMEQGWTQSLERLADALAQQGAREDSVPPRVVSRDEWLVARKALLAKERELTHARDRLAAERRALPWVKVDKPYVFDTPAGRTTLGDLFGDKSQLAIYHFMLAPNSHHICPGCAFLADHVDAARQHFEHADLAFAAVSRAPLARIEEVRKRMGWRFNWVSAFGSDFNYDYGVSFTDAQIAAGKTDYNYGTTPSAHPDLPGTSIFAKDAAGDVFHTYSAYTRGSEQLIGALNWLDLTPKGRNESGVMSWVRLHDEYGGGANACCHRTNARRSPDGAERNPG